MKRLLVAVVATVSLLNLVPWAGAAEAPDAQHCLPFLPDNAVTCLVKCVVQTGSVKQCDVVIMCPPNLPTVCFVLSEVWKIVP